MPNFTRGNVSLYYEDQGRGAPAPMLFVHGWCCDHTSFQQAYFSRVRRTIAVDLRGHGGSDAPIQNYDTEEFVDDLIHLCRELAPTKHIVVGHSMGGTVALQFAARCPEYVAAAVLIDSVVFPTVNFVKSLRPIAHALFGPDYLAALETLQQLMFLPSDDTNVRSRICGLMSRTPQHVLAPAFDNHIFRYDATAAAASLRIPVAYIASDNIVVDLHRFRELCPQLKTGQTVGVGHFATALAPTQINSMLEEFCRAQVSSVP
ncbi:alpha/beta fold hydrolase [Bradyrhizobium cenepequi]|uniref:alpha/beta fold hydrolase n=1 Tax=Bradyrhizobium cenepequi TaxID=2821403 RepID=UPI001CE28E6F|nr:alpha/beta hydrolase [Bradyrhizobium cenepequi]MCA6111197.1 alpha/beta hydrolase [Bradyrhizobium cenepequi]